MMGRSAAAVAALATAATAVSAITTSCPTGSARRCTSTRAFLHSSSASRLSTRAQTTSRTKTQSSRCSFPLLWVGVSTLL